MTTLDDLRVEVDTVLRRRGTCPTGPTEWGFLDRNGVLIDAHAEDDPAAFVAAEVRALRRDVDAMAAERAAADTVSAPPTTRAASDLASRIQAQLESSERSGDDDRPGLWERARAAAMLFYLERTGRAPASTERTGSGRAPTDDAAAFEIAHPVRVVGVTTVGEHQATTKVTLAIDPTLSAAQVAAVWQRVRAAVLRQGARGRTVSRKSLALALFVAHHPGRPWAELRRTWNQLYSHWAFKSPDLRVFRNAAVRARRYLLEPPVVDQTDASRWHWVHRRTARLTPGTSGDVNGASA
jgi:hypothetical protein